MISSSRPFPPARNAGALSLRRARPLALALPLLAFLPAWAAAAGATADRWRPLGPEGGEVLSVLADPREPGMVYAGLLGGGVFVSQDDGRSWRPAAAGLLASRVDALAKGATPEAALYAGTDRGIYRLAAGATAWERVGAGLPVGEIVGRLVVDPERPTTLYAVVEQGRITGAWAIYKTTDGGASWSQVALQATLAPVLAIAPTSPPTLYAASSQGLHRSTDRGATWETATAGLPLSPQFSDLAVDPSAPATLYAVAYRRTAQVPAVYKSLDRGSTWTVASQGLPVGFAAAGRLALDPRRPGLVYFGDASGAFRTTDGGQLWTPVRTGPADRKIHALAVDPSRGTVFAGGSRFAAGGDVGVLRSFDSGATWQAGASDLPGSFATGLSPDPQHPGRLVLATDSRGVLQSDDGGAQWAPAGGIAAASVGHLVRDPSSPATLYLLAGDSPAALTRVYRSTDGGAQWAAPGAVFACCLSALAVDPHHPGTLYAAREGELYRSPDGGATWSAPLNAEPLGRLDALAVHPTIPGLLLAGSSHDSGLPVSPPLIINEVLRSTDGGATWTQAVEREGGPVLTTWSLAFDALHPRRVFATAAGLVVGLVLESDDAGATWAAVTGLGSESVQSVLANPGRPGELFAGTTKSGVLRSVDDGATWQPYGDGLLGGDVRVLALAPAAGTIWAGTAGAGVYALERAALPPCANSTTVLCLAGRFQVTVDWQDFAGHQGAGRSVPLTATTGAFWFFGPDNLEMAVKIVDGRPVNGHHWFFYGGLSTVRYTVTVLDTATGVERRYENPSGHLASAGDTAAFPSPLGAAASHPASAGRSTAATPPSPLLLSDGRFRLELRWRTAAGSTGDGTGVPLTHDTGALWFFAPDNLEIFVKILDGRPLNGHFWLFLGALSDVGFDLAVTDTVTGARREYSHPPGTFGSRVDVQLF